MKAMDSVIYVEVLVNGLSVNCMMTTIWMRFSIVMMISVIAYPVMIFIGGYRNTRE